MKVFLTGVSGYLGRSMAAHLLAQGYLVAGSSRRAITMPGIDIVPMALGDRIDPEMFRGCDVVLHAAHDFVPGCMNKNIEGTLAIRDAAAKAGVRQQIFLTSYSARPDAESEYGRTKYALENAFNDSLRLGLVIGNGGLFARQRTILLRTPIVPMIGNGTAPVAILAISHLLAATEEIVRGQLGGPRNLFYDARPTMKEFVRGIKEQAAQRPVFVPISVSFATAALKVAKVVGLRIPIDAGQIRALQLNESSSWASDLPALLPGHANEFQLSYALDQLKLSFAKL